MPFLIGWGKVFCDHHGEKAVDREIVHHQGIAQRAGNVAFFEADVARRVLQGTGGAFTVSGNILADTLLFVLTIANRLE